MEFPKSYFLLPFLVDLIKEEPNLDAIVISSIVLIDLIKQKSVLDVRVVFLLPFLIELTREVSYLDPRLHALIP